MKVIKPFTLGVLHRPYPFQGRNWLAVAALGFFRLGADQDRLLDDSSQWAAVLPLLPAGMPLDEVMPKPRGEALLLGTAYAPARKPVGCMCVRMAVGAIDKSLHVSGERAWRYGLAPWQYTVSNPLPFTAMPLDSARAYGGAGHPANPGGCGYAGWRGARAGVMPNLEYPEHPVRSHWRRLAPAGFGPIAASCAPRAGKLGTYGARWLAQEAPGFAGDIDWTAFNLAPADQWLSGFFEGGEAYRLEGLHPDRPVLEGRLPRFKARAFVLEDGLAPQQAREVALRLDTVWFLPGIGLGVMVFHGRTEVADSDGRDIGILMAGYEHADAPRSAAHYHAVMALRSDPATAAQHAFNESQLAPERSAAAQHAHAQAEAREQAAQLAARQRVLDELDAEYWQKADRPAPAGHQPPQAAPAPIASPSPSALAARDFDLSATIEQARLLAAKAQQDADLALAALRAKAPAPAAPCPEAQYSAALERAVVPAYDLFEADDTGRDLRVAGQLAALARAREAGQLADAARYEQARSAVLAGPALRRGTRRYASRPAALDAPLCPQAALRLGAQVRAWLRAGVCLAGRDLAGADLRGIDLGGADLREVMLEGADLSGATLIGARLDGAVLSGAMLERADFSGAVLDDANLSASCARGARFAGASLVKAQAIGADWRAADLTGAVLDQLLGMKLMLGGATLDRVRAHGAMLLEAQADDSRWHGADLRKVVAVRASLQRADFSGVSAERCTFVQARLAHSVWERATMTGLQAPGNTDWSGASLRGASADKCGLNGAIFAGADFSQGHFLACDFGDANLRGACLDDARFPESILMGACLAGASARGADLFRALCRKADFSGAALDGARLFQADLSGATLAAGSPA